MHGNIASYIDHTILKPSTTLADVGKHCAEALACRFAAVCVPPYYVTDAKTMVSGAGIKVATVIGFPFGYNTTHSKIQEIRDAIAAGADELDMVHNQAALKNNDWDYLESEIQLAADITNKEAKIIKIIVESGLLTDDELKKCCELYGKYPINFLKTSTGYAEKGATIHAVDIMHTYLPPNIAIKASGGIRNFAFAIALINAGATRLGCSASVQIINESKGIDFIE